MTVCSGETFERVLSWAQKPVFGLILLIPVVGALHPHMLIVHMIGEESFLYPVLENNSDTHSLILESYEEHNLGKQLSEEISTLNVDDVKWTAKIKVLKDMIEHHAEEEEGLLFPKAKDIIKDDQQKEIARKMQDLKASNMK